MSYSAPPVIPLRRSSVSDLEQTTHGYQDLHKNQNTLIFWDTRLTFAGKEKHDLFYLDGYDPACPMRTDTKHFPYPQNKVIL